MEGDAGRPRTLERRIQSAWGGLVQRHSVGGRRDRRLFVHRLIVILTLTLTSGGLLSLSGSARADDGTVLRTITAQNYSCPIGTGIAFDGTNLLLSCDSDNVITAVSPNDGAFVRSYAISGVAAIGALAWDRGRNKLWACGGFDGDDTIVYQIDLASESATIAFTGGPGCPDGLAYDGVDDTLWLSPDVSPTVYHYSITGTQLATYPANLGSCGNSGIAVGGPYLFLANDGCSEIYRAGKSDPTATQLFGSYPARLEDMECDDLTFKAGGKAAIWSKDAYDAVLNAFELNPGDCGFGGLPPNAPAITSITERIGATTPMYNIDLTVALRNVTCPASLSLTTGSLNPVAATICAGGEAAPAEVHVLQPVFDNSGQLPPDTEVGVAASVNGAAVFRTTIATPPAPIWVGLGDSYASGHHQTVDSTYCIITPVSSCHVYPNDPAFSWVSDGGDSAAAKLNARLGVPNKWRMRSVMLGISGAKTTDFGKDGQLAAMRDAIETHAGSWNVVSFTGGADDANFSAALRSYYGHHPQGKPWAVSAWSRANCPDSDSVYARAIAAAPGIRSALKKVMSTASASSASTRFVDVGYPYVVPKGNVCGTNHRTGSGTWYGSNTVVDFLDTLHRRLSAPGLVHVDLRSQFNRSAKLSDLQLTRYYGYPHPDASGQNLIAGLAAAAVQ
jgi:hypothetical protein